MRHDTMDSVMSTDGTIESYDAREDSDYDIRGADNERRDNTLPPPPPKQQDLSLLDPLQLAKFASTALDDLNNKLNVKFDFNTFEFRSPPSDLDNSTLPSGPSGSFHSETAGDTLGSNTVGTLDESSVSIIIETKQQPIYEQTQISVRRSSKNTHENNASSRESVGSESSDASSAGGTLLSESDDDDYESDGQTEFSTRESFEGDIDETSQTVISIESTEVNSELPPQGTPNKQPNLQLISYGEDLHVSSDAWSLGKDEALSEADAKLLLAENDDKPAKQVKRNSKSTQGSKPTSIRTHSSRNTSTGTHGSRNTSTGTHGSRNTSTGTHGGKATSSRSQGSKATSSRSQGSKATSSRSQGSKTSSGSKHHELLSDNSPEIEKMTLKQLSKPTRSNADCESLSDSPEIEKMTLKQLRKPTRSNADCESLSDSPEIEKVPSKKDDVQQSSRKNRKKKKILVELEEMNKLDELAAKVDNEILLVERELTSEGSDNEPFVLMSATDMAEDTREPSSRGILKGKRFMKKLKSSMKFLAGRRNNDDNKEKSVFKSFSLPAIQEQKRPFQQQNHYYQQQKQNESHKSSDKSSSKSSKKMPESNPLAGKTDSSSNSSIGKNTTDFLLSGLQENDNNNGATTKKNPENNSMPAQIIVGGDSVMGDASLLTDHVLDTQQQQKQQQKQEQKKEQKQEQTFKKSLSTSVNNASMKKVLNRFRNKSSSKYSGNTHNSNQMKDMHILEECDKYNNLIKGVPMHVVAGRDTPSICFDPSDDRYLPADSSMSSDEDDERNCKDQSVLILRDDFIMNDSERYES